MKYKQRIVRWLFLKKLLVVFSLVALIIVVALVVLHKLAGPAVGTVSNTRSPNNPSYLNTNQSVTYKGKYVIFSYPSRYLPIGTKLTGQFIEVYGLYSRDHTNISIMISVQRELLSNDSGVTYRLHSPSQYTLLRSGPDSIVFQSTKNGYEQDEFIAHNDLVASIVIVAPSESIIGSDFNQVVNSLQWQ